MFLINARINTHDVDNPLGLIDAVDLLLDVTTCG